MSNNNDKIRYSKDYQVLVPFVRFNMDYTCKHCKKECTKEQGAYLEVNMYALNRRGNEYDKRYFLHRACSAGNAKWKEYDQFNIDSALAVETAEKNLAEVMVLIRKYDIDVEDIAHELGVDINHY